MLCPYCGSEIQEGVVYCPICNAALMETPAQGQVGGQVASGQYANQQPYGVQPGYACPGTMPGGQAGLAQGVGQAFPNARKGLSNLFFAQAVVIASAAFALIAAIVALVAATGSWGSSANNAAFGILGIIAIVVGVFSLAASIARLVGLWQAGKDEQNFKIAFIVTIVAIVIELIGPSIGAAATTSSIASTSSVTSALSLISSLASLVVLALIYRGIISIMNRLGRQDVASSVNTLFVASIVCFVVAILVPFIAVFSFSLVYIAAVIAALLVCIPDILLLVALSKGKNALIRS